MQVPGNNFPIFFFSDTLYEHMSLAFLPMICPRTAAKTARNFSLKGATDWQVHLFDSEQELRKGWPAGQRDDDFWLQPAVLSFLINQPQGLDTAAVLLENRKDDRRVMLTTQTFYFNAGGQVSEAAKGETSSYDFRRRLLAPFSFKVLSIGQFLVSGNYATEGLDRLSPEETAQVLPALANALMLRGNAYAGVLIKDLHPTDHPATRTLQKEGFYLLPADPIMEVAIPREWSTMADYLDSIKSKYRVRCRRARAKMEGISRRALSPEEVTAYRDRLFALYRTTMSGADFNAASLSPNYFPWLAGYAEQKVLNNLSLPQAGGVALANVLAPTTQLHGYFNQEGQLIGFTSLISNGNTMHAHFLGMEEAYKRSHHLYHNMLLDLLEEAILGGFEKLDYARTAPEIKSSVGATAVDYACLIRVRSGLINPLVPIFAPAVYKATEWVPRNPFPAPAR